MTLGLIVVAAGTSRRMDGIDKIWTDLNGRPVLVHSLDRLRSSVDRCIIVVSPSKLDDARRDLRQLAPGANVVSGGATRQQSVRLGLAALGALDSVAVHDGARPLASPALLREGLILLEQFDGAIPAVPLPDTVKRVGEGDVIVETVNRNRLRAAQTPQLFRADSLTRAHERAHLNGAECTDDAQLIERDGGRVAVFPGATSNIKITTPVDLEFARCLLARDRSS